MYIDMISPKAVIRPGWYFDPRCGFCFSETLPGGWIYLGVDSTQTGGGFRA